MIEKIVRAWPRALDCCAVNDKQILITGATNGIGLAAAEALAALGANLAIVGRSKTRTRIASARIRAGGREGSDGGDIHRRPLVAGFGAQISRRSAGPLSKAACAR
ncbi:MAG TPA: SDR family NAD(P)-dependent oxidoreductase [Xanthobacteraceae bacterium]|nr:SDR family NAD(P)-dependent oxidoreductase [Xanthobacteraceae bacterium]